MKRKNLIFAFTLSVTTLFPSLWGGADKGSLFAQCLPMIKIDGNEIIADANASGGIKLPTWLKAGQTLAKGQYVFSISVIEFTVNGTALDYSQNISVTTVQTVPVSKVWKIESIHEDPSYSVVLAATTYSTAGSYTYNPSCSGTYRVQVWGAGGGGGGGAGGTDTYALNSGGGGGGGYAEGTYSLNVSNSYSVTVGSGGTGGNNGNGTAGGASSVGTISISANGGGLGIKGGAGGALGTGSGQINYSGTVGGNGGASGAVGTSGGSPGSVGAGYGGGGGNGYYITEIPQCCDGDGNPLPSTYAYTYAAVGSAGTAGKVIITLVTAAGAVVPTQITGTISTSTAITSGSPVVFSTKCAWMTSCPPTCALGSCTPPACPGGWTDLGVYNVPTSVAGVTTSSFWVGYSERSCVKSSW